MSTVNIRRQGGAAIITIPAEVVKKLGLDVGSQLTIEPTEDGFVARARAPLARKRYSLTELLRGATPEAMQQLNDETAWAREGDPTGREI